MIINNLNEIIENITTDTKKIKMGIKIYQLAKTTLGNIATKIKGIDFELDSTLENNEIKLI